MAVNTDRTLRNQVMYQIFPRNYSIEGTFRAVERDLDRIQDLGADIIWFTPIHPIGEKNRKGTLGSPYAIKDYRAVNPEFGDKEGLKSLVDAIHARGMKCIIDVVDLDYADRGLWKYQIDTLKKWAEIVDGFRCDVAPLVSLEFWLEARAAVEEVRPGAIWLCEFVEPRFITYMRSRGLNALSDAELYQAFDISYDYDIFDDFEAYFDGKGTLEQYAESVNRQEYGVSHLPGLFDKDVVPWDDESNTDLTGLIKKMSEIRKDPLFANSSYHVWAAGGSEYVSVDLTPAELETASEAAGWCDVCAGWEN